MIPEHRIKKKMQPADGWGYPFKIDCPICDFDYTRITSTITIDEKKAESLHQGDPKTIIVFEGECGHRWQAIYTTLKGQTYLKLEKLANSPQRRI